MLISSCCRDDQLINSGHCALTSDKTNQYAAASSLIVEDHEMCEETSGEWPQFSYYCHLDPCLAIKQQAYINIFQWQQVLASVLLLCKTVTIKTEKKNKFFFFLLQLCVWVLSHRCNVIWGCSSVCWKVFMKDMSFGAHSEFILLQTWLPCVVSMQVILLLLIISLSAFTQ